jgi:hypothetical protein
MKYPSKRQKREIHREGLMKTEADITVKKP